MSIHEAMYPVLPNFSTFGIFHISKHSVGMANNISCASELILGVSAQTKRKKIAYLLREVFDYQHSTDKRKTIDSAYKLIQRKPQLLIDSISRLEKKIDKLREVYNPEYQKQVIINEAPKGKGYFE